MKQKNIFGLTFLFFMQASCMELVISTDNRSCPLYIPHDIVQIIAYNYNDHTIQTIRNYKRTCKAFNDAFHYWMIEPTLIQAQNINALNKGLISFSHLYGDKSKTHIKKDHYKSFTHFLQYEPGENKKSLKLLGWPKNLSIEEKINAYQGLPAEKINYWYYIFKNNLSFTILALSINPNNLQDKDGKTALEWAYQTNNVKKIKLLLSQKIKLNAQNKHGQTILHKIFSTSSIRERNVGIIKLLLNTKDLNFNIQDNKGNTYLHSLCSNPCLGKDCIKIIKILSKNNNCDKNIVNNQGQTALHQICSKPFCSKKDKKIITLLLQNTANPNLPDKNGQTILHKICSQSSVSKQDIKKMTLLLENKANPNILDKGGETCLHKICSGSWLSKQQIKTITLLLEKKANPNIPNKTGDTVLDIARKMDFVQAELISLLKLHHAHNSWQYRIPTLRNVALVALLGSFAMYAISKK